MTNLDPSLPGQHSDLVDGKNKATPWFRRWFERVDAKLITVETAAASATAAVAAIPAPVASPLINGINGVDVTGSPTTGWTISAPAIVAQAQASTTLGLLMLADNDPGEQWPALTAQVAPVASSQTPYFIPAGEVFTVAANKQVLYSRPIETDGELVIDGHLEEVN